MAIHGLRSLKLLSMIYLSLLAGAARAGGIVGTGDAASCTGEALAAALTGGGTVGFNCGPVPVTIAINGTGVVNDGESLRIDGGHRITLDGGDSLEHFYVLAGGTLELRRIELANGRAFVGGAILNQGSVSLEGTTFTGNDAELFFGNGGAIYNDYDALLTVVDSFFSENRSEGGGGAIHNRGVAEIRVSRFENNSAGNQGGAIENVEGATTLDRSTILVNSATHGGGIELNRGTFLVRRSTLLGNEASTAGGGIRNILGTLTLENVTLAGNQAGLAGGGLYAEDATTIRSSTFHINKAPTGGAVMLGVAAPVTALNTIFSLSLVPGTIDPVFNCDGFPITSNGFNLSSDNLCTSLASDRSNVNPNLGPIANNGGPTQTHLPQPGSAAINNGTNVGCPATDQRGAARPQNGGSSASICDIGAVEVPEPSLALALAAGVTLIAVANGPPKGTRRRAPRPGRDS